MTRCSMSRHCNFLIQQFLLWICLQQLHCCCGNLVNSPKSCRTDGVPVCARDGKDYILFPNECALEDSNRAIYFDRPYYKKAKLINCLPACNLKCTRKAEPVCAVNQINGEEKNFDNLCEMAKQSCLDDMDWTVVADGQCVPAKILDVVTPKPLPKRRVLKKRRRPIKCSERFNPVCASYAGVKSTFKNECLVNAENIRTGKTWEIFAKGICEEDYANLARGDDVKSKRSISSYHAMNSYYGARSQPHYFAPHYYQPPQQAISKAYNDGLSYIVPPTIFRTETVDSETKAISNKPYVEELKFEDKNFTNQLMAAPMVEVGNMAKDYTNCQFGNKPTCGISDSDTRTFRNMCELIFANINGKRTWTILQEGVCPSCEFNCLNTYEPVCVAHNRKNVTITNKCHLRAKMCEKKRDSWALLHNGACVSAKKKLPTTAATTTTTAAPMYFLLQHPHQYAKKYTSKSAFVKGLQQSVVREATAENTGESTVSVSNTTTITTPAIETETATEITTTPTTSTTKAVTTNYVMILYKPHAQHQTPKRPTTVTTNTSTSIPDTTAAIKEGLSTPGITASSAANETTTSAPITDTERSMRKSVTEYNVDS